MASFNLSELGSQLKDITQIATSTGVSFAHKSLKLNTEEDASEVVKAIRECIKLEFLDLEGNTLGPLAAKAIAQALEEKGSFLKRALWKDMFTGRLKTEIPKAIQYLGSSLCAAGTCLVELDLSDNAFGPIGVEGLANFLTSSTCYTLQELRLNNNGLGISGGKMLAKALSNCYENSSKTGTSPLALKVFVAGRNRLENEGATALASVFQKLTSLEEVVMPQNGIYYQGITALANGLSANPGLRILDLNDNTVGIKGAKALAKALPNFGNLEELNLGDCLLKTQGSIVLARALGIEGNHPSLQKVNLSFNEIRKNGAHPIAVAMADKEQLTTLQLDGNAFGKEGRDILQKSLTVSERIGTLSMEDDEGDADDSDEGIEENSESESKENEDGDNNDDDSDDDGEDNIAVSKVTVEQFLKLPTSDNLLSLQGDFVIDFINHAKELSNNANTSHTQKFIEELTRIVMKVSSLYSTDTIVSLKAQLITNALYSELCSYAVETNKTAILTHALLVNLGLIKSEDKHNQKIDWDLEGCFKALEQIIHKDYFLEDTRTTLNFFLDLTSNRKNTDSCQETKNSLKAALNRIQRNRS
ncbi:Ran GTPase-activating protein 1 [Dufourea novaeangliae]|uniref:Ran GTPase-activating protein 1 n=1 Tax=Dufourea novaeangliae TaxID=178035 RepID=A0A154NYQ7_DUFNO|nr:Ran GTPase-activating protein 1 [Dufourea novaeangliae]